LLLLLLLCGTAVATGYIWHAVNGNHNKWLYNWWFIFDGTFFGRFPEFFIGMLLAYYCKKEHRILEKLPKKNMTLFAGLLCLISIYCMSLFEKDIYSHGTEFVQGLVIRNLILPFFIALLLYGLMTEETWFKKFLSLRAMVLLGNASYIFYLIHIGYVNQKMTAKFILFDRNLILLWLIAIGGYLLIEKPIYNVCRKAIKRW
jgi:peptidoglycan/LPS O-acetylase OafA/YrhL